MVRTVLWLQLTVARSERELSFYSNPAKFLKFLKSNPIKSLKFVVHRTVDKCFSHLYGYIHWEKTTSCTSLTQIYFNHQRNCIQQWWCSMETLRWHISNATSIAYSTLAEDCLCPLALFTDTNSPFGATIVPNSMTYTKKSVFNYNNVSKCRVSICPYKHACQSCGDSGHPRIKCSKTVAPNTPNMVPT